MMQVPLGNYIVAAVPHTPVRAYVPRKAVLRAPSALPGCAQTICGFCPMRPSLAVAEGPSSARIPADWTTATPV